MEYLYKQCFCALLCGLIGIIAVTSGATEEKDEVTMELYKASMEEWDSTGQQKFSEFLAAEANTYCRATPDKCYMKSSPPEDPLYEFQEDDYEQISAVKEKSYLIVKFSLLLPSEKNMVDGHTNDMYLTKKALEAAATKAAETFREQTDMTIVDIEGELQPLSPDNTLNIAISLTAIAVLIIMIVALCIMQHKCGGGKKSHHDKHDGKGVSVA